MRNNPTQALKPARTSGRAKSTELINAVIVALSERELSASEMRTARCMVGSGAGMLVAVWFSPVLAGMLFVVFALCVSMLEKGGAR